MHAVLALSASVLASVNLAAAQTAEETPRFAPDAAAKCAAAYAFTLDAMMRADGVPDKEIESIRRGLAMWEYELAAAAPTAPAAELQGKADAAVRAIAEGMPNGDGREGAQARGDYLMSAIEACEAQIETVYAGKVHPVIPFLERDAVSVRPETAETNAAPSRGLR